MCKILKLSLLVLAGVFFSCIANAQFKRPHVLVFGNLAYASPGNDALKVNYKGGVAGEVGGGIGWGKTMLVGSLGYQLFSSRSGVASGNLRIIPFKAGIRQYIIGPLFVLGNAGIATQSYAHVSNSGSSFLYELGGGLKLSILELQITHNGWKQPGAGAYSNALFIKAGWALKF